MPESVQLLAMTHFVIKLHHIPVHNTVKTELDSQQIPVRKMMVIVLRHMPCTKLGPVGVERGQKQVYQWEDGRLISSLIRGIRKSVPQDFPVLDLRAQSLMSS